MNADTPTPPTPAGLPARAAVLPGARVSLALLLLINLLNYIDRYILAATEPLIRKEFFSPDDPNAGFRMGSLATAFLITYLITAPIFGWLADRYRRWVLIALGVILWSLASGGSGLAASFAFLLIMRILVGVGEAAYGPTAPTLISDLYPVERRGAVLAWFYAAIPFGSALGYVLGGAVAKFASWHWAFLITLPPGLLLGVLCFLRREPPRGLADSATRARAASIRDYAVLLRTPSYLLDLAGMTAFTFAIGGISFWMPTYFHEHRGQANLAQVNLVFGGITAVGGLAATLIGGKLGDRLRPVMKGSYFIVSGAGMLIALPFFFGTLYLPFPLAYFSMFIAIFFLFISTGPTNTIIANVTHPAVRASAFAIAIFVIHALGDAISPPLIGLITDLTRTPARPQGDMTFAFVLLSGMIALAGILWILGARWLEEDTRLAPSRLADPAPRQG